VGGDVYLESVFFSFFPFFFHVMVGSGSPAAWQKNTAIPLPFTACDWGGRVISGGSEKTARKLMTTYTADFLKVNIALQWIVGKYSLLEDVGGGGAYEQILPRGDGHLCIYHHVVVAVGIYCPLGV
jgi:hypothetical protein